MMVVDCPTYGRTMVSESSIRNLFNVAPGVMVVRWDCPSCAEDHMMATGREATADARKAEAALSAVRQVLASA